MVNKEFENYKLRAQSVLKHNKAEENDRAKKLEENLALEKVNGALNDKIKSLR